MRSGGLLMVWLHESEVQSIPGSQVIFNLNLAFSLNFLKRHLSGWAFVRDFSQEDDFPGSKLLLSSARTPEA
jgi:hypothetical protein